MRIFTEFRNVGKNKNTKNTFRFSDYNNLQSHEVCTPPNIFELEKQMTCMIKQTVFRNEILKDLIFRKDKYCRIGNFQVHDKREKDTRKHKIYDDISY